MNTWLSFLSSQNGQFDENNGVSFGESPSEYQALAKQATFSPLLDRGILAVSGSDTDKLLQGQLTCDMNQLVVGGSLPGALCDNKGRLISSFLALRPTEGQVLLVMQQDILPSTLATLKKYAVFYKTVLEELTAEYCCFGLNKIPHAERPTLCGKLTDDLHLALVPTADAISTWEALARGHTAAGSHFWQYLLIHHGLGEVRPETQGEFIPQMLNLQHTGAINFRKGCYTGQEIVARMQYLGKLKRRAYYLIASTTTAIGAGTTIHSDEKSDVGTVVLSEPSGPATQSVLAVLTSEAARASRLRFGEQEAPIQLQPLPYDEKFADGKVSGANGA